MFALTKLFKALGNISLNVRNMNVKPFHSVSYAKILLLLGISSMFVLFSDSSRER